jgi:hypothetical protein
MMKFLTVTTIAVTTATVAAGAASADRASVNARCLPVRTATLAAIRSGLHASVRPKLRSARAVKAKGDFSHAPRGFQAGVYFISPTFVPWALRPGRLARASTPRRGVASRL